MVFHYFRRIELAPDIVDADEDGHIIGCKVQYIRLPPCSQISGGVSADPHVDHPKMQRGVGCPQQSIHDSHIAFSNRAEQSFSHRPGPLKVSDGVADADNFASFFKQQCHDFPP